MTVAKDTHGAVTTGATSTTQGNADYWECPESGDYLVGAQALTDSTSWASGEGFSLRIYQDANRKHSNEWTSDSTITKDVFINIVPKVMSIAKGEKIYLAGAGVGKSVGLSTSAIYTYLSIHKVMGNQQAMLGETVAARYDTDAGQSIDNASYEVVNFDSTTFGYDTHNCVTTGASWVFTANRAMKVNLLTKIRFTSNAWTAGQLAELKVYKNGGNIGTLDDYECEANSTRYVSLQGSIDVDLNKDDTLDVRAYQNTGGGLALSSDEENNYICISIIG
jgi:hypothetical protein